MLRSAQMKPLPTREVKLSDTALLETARTILHLFSWGKYDEHWSAHSLQHVDVDLTSIVQGSHNGTSIWGKDDHHHPRPPTLKTSTIAFAHAARNHLLGVERLSKIPRRAHSSASGPTPSPSSSAASQCSRRWCSTVGGR